MMSAARWSALHMRASVSVAGNQRCGHSGEGYSKRFLEGLWKKGVWTGVWTSAATREHCHAGLPATFVSRVCPACLSLVSPRSQPLIPPTALLLWPSTAPPGVPSAGSLVYRQRHAHPVLTRPEFVEQSSTPAAATRCLSSARLHSSAHLCCHLHNTHTSSLPYTTCKTTAPSVLPQLSVLARARPLHATCRPSTTTPARASACAPAATTPPPPPSTLLPVASANLLPRPRARRMRRHRYLAPDLCHCNVP